MIPETIKNFNVRENALEFTRNDKTKKNVRFSRRTKCTGVSQVQSRAKEWQNVTLNSRYAQPQVQVEVNVCTKYVTILWVQILGTHLRSRELYRGCMNTRQRLQEKVHFFPYVCGFGIPPFANPPASYVTVQKGKKQQNWKHIKHFIHGKKIEKTLRRQLNKIQLWKKYSDINKKNPT